MKTNIYIVSKTKTKEGIVEVPTFHSIDKLTEEAIGTAIEEIRATLVGYEIIGETVITYVKELS